MAWSSNALKIFTSWAKTGDRETPESQGIDRDKGWESVYSTDLASGGKAPEREVFNQLIFERDEALREIGTYGVPNWSSQIVYDIGSRVQRHSEAFRAIKASGPGTTAGAIEPGTDLSAWVGDVGLIEIDRRGLVYNANIRELKFDRDIRLYSSIRCITVVWGADLKGTRTWTPKANNRDGAIPVNRAGNFLTHGYNFHIIPAEEIHEVDNTGGGGGEGIIVGFNSDGDLYSFQIKKSTPAHVDDSRTLIISFSPDPNSVGGKTTSHIWIYAE